MLAWTVGLAAYAGIMFCAVGASTWIWAQYCWDWVVQETYEFCGDWVVQTWESCDVWSMNGNVCTPVYGGGCSYCSSDCARVEIVGPKCGDGNVDANESCDDGNRVDADGCNNLCQKTFCWDWAVQAWETCDNGNSNGVACNPWTWTCTYCSSSCDTQTVVWPRCGDGKVDAGESCDDGNSNNLDSCNNSCKTTFCGDGAVQAWETCDNGNNNGVVCNPGTWTCEYCSATCEPMTIVWARCGDGKVDAGETCDDGNSNNNDGCTNTCQATYCWDWVVQAWETCDNGPSNGSVCTPWSGSSCSYCTASCKSVTLEGASCGNGKVESWEICDDGNLTDGDWCSQFCLKEPTLLLDTWAWVPPVVETVPTKQISLWGEPLFLPTFLPSTWWPEKTFRWVELNNN